MVQIDSTSRFQVQHAIAITRQHLNQKIKALVLSSSSSALLMILSQKMLIEKQELITLREIKHKCNICGRLICLFLITTINLSFYYYYHSFFFLSLDNYTYHEMRSWTHGDSNGRTFIEIKIAANIE